MSLKKIIEKVGAVFLREMIDSSTIIHEYQDEATRDRAFKAHFEAAKSQSNKPKKGKKK